MGTPVNVIPSSNPYDFDLSKGWTVWKFRLAESVASLKDNIVVDMPDLHQALSVQVQNGQVVLWALVHPKAAKRPVLFRIAGTGHALELEQCWQHVATVQFGSGSLVFHIFEHAP